MGSKPCFCESPKNQYKEINIIIDQFSQEKQIPVKTPQKPVALQMMKSLKKDDEFELFLIMEKYERLLQKQNKRYKATSPSQQIKTETKEITTTYNFYKQIGKIDYQKSKSLSNTKLSTSSQRSTIKSILKKRSTQNQISYQQTSVPQRSFKSVHFDKVSSPKNSVQGQMHIGKRKTFLRSYQQNFQ
ncbi:unnamed protein product [Paramecium pentaurelia]|uniref:Uncharacterized protein n=1 Tax=Paramecium pentaurelia TaxID=43138 RepID=A0A8S1SJC0_9CILI|nr:unnamed protein product [Paramecium pentaurelia]